MKRISIINGMAFDPRQGWKGENRDLFIEDGMIVDGFSHPDHVIDAKGRLVVAAGIDMHAHVASYGLNLARYSFEIPTVREIALSYARMGYLYVNEALMTLHTASAVHHELSSIPFLDTSASLVLDPRDFWQQFKGERTDDLESILSFLLAMTKSIGIKIYDPSIYFSMQHYRHRNTPTPGVLSALASLDKYKLGKICVQISSQLQGLDLKGASIFHLCQGSTDLTEENIVHSTFDLLRKGASLDLSLLDGTGLRVQTNNHRKGKGGRALSVGMGLAAPIVFFDKREPLKGFQLARRALDLRPSYISFSSGTSPRLLPGSTLGSLSDLLTKGSDDDGISISEWVEATRSTPAMILGLKTKGHLGVGAQADIAIYDIVPETPANLFREKLCSCWALMKKGVIVIRDFRFVNMDIQTETYYRKLVDPEAKSKPYTKGTMLQKECLQVDPIFIRNEVGLSV
jgi:hypothetical protein